MGCLAATSATSVTGRMPSFTQSIATSTLTPINTKEQRVRFIAILKSSPPDAQAKIVRGVLQRFPHDDEYKPTTRTKELYEELADIARRLEGASPVARPEPKITSAVVERAIGDAETLIQTRGAVSGVDRIHTALHGYLRAVCDGESISYNKEDSMTRLFKLLRPEPPSASKFRCAFTRCRACFSVVCQYYGRA